MIYIVVSATGTEDLESAVQEKLDHGYQLQGGVAMSALVMKRDCDQDEMVVMYSQAMVDVRL